MLIIRLFCHFVLRFNAQMLTTSSQNSLTVVIFSHYLTKKVGSPKKDCNFLSQKWWFVSNTCMLTGMQRVLWKRTAFWSPKTGTSVCPSSKKPGKRRSNLTRISTTWACLFTTYSLGNNTRSRIWLIPWLKVLMLLLWDLFWMEKFNRRYLKLNKIWLMVC